jgi:hypothetical protein
MGKREIYCFFLSIRFVILLLGFIRMVGELHHQLGTQYHFVIAGRLFLWCNAPISLPFCFLYVQRSEAPSENLARGCYL